MKLHWGNIGVGALMLAAALAGSAQAAQTEVRVARQYGVGYLPLMVMEHRHLIREQAEAAGLGKIKVSWNTFADGSVANDALLSGNLDFAGGGTGAFVTLWAKTRSGSLGVKSVGAMDSMPMFLNTNDPDIKTVKDFTGKHRIGMAGVKVSPQAMTLQLAAAHAWGQKNYGKLDPLTVGMSHPLAMQALLSGQIAADFTSPPFQYWELQKPGIHRVLNSYDVWGGPQTFLCVWTTSKFHDDNPKLYAAFAAALKQSIDWMNAHKQEAADIYKTATHDKHSVESILKILNDPDVDFTMTPKNVVKFAQWKYKTGAIKVEPKSWKDMFFSNVWHLPGS